MASIPRPQIPGVDDVAVVARDLAYTMIGFGVLGFQQAQVRRREAQRALSPFVDALLSALPCDRGQAK